MSESWLHNIKLHSNKVTYKKNKNKKALNEVDLYWTENQLLSEYWLNFLFASKENDWFSRKS